MERICPTCKEKYEDGGDHWKKVCYGCYKNYKYLQISSPPSSTSKRIKRYVYKCDLYLTHPSVNKEELDEWIKENNLEHGWGCEEWKPENWDKFKIWVNSTNYD